MMQKVKTLLCKIFERVMDMVLADLRKEARMRESLQEIGEAISVHIGQLGETIWEKCLRESRNSCVLRTPGSQSPADIWEYIPGKEINLYQVKASAIQEPPDPSEKDEEKLRKLKKKVEEIAYKLFRRRLLVNTFWVKIRIYTTHAIQSICIKRGYKDIYKCLNSMFESGEIKIEQCKLKKRDKKRAIVIGIIVGKFNSNMRIRVKVEIEIIYIS